jgi:hypothetical protein
MPAVRVTNYLDERIDADGLATKDSRRSLCAWLAARREREAPSAC